MLFDNNFNIEDYFKETVGEGSEASGQAEVTMPSKKGSEALKEALVIVMTKRSTKRVVMNMLRRIVVWLGGGMMSLAGGEEKEIEALMESRVYWQIREKSE
eukprot:GHVP01004126.1.p1 GENE.GHVP01004126.1~~GHVP01004126.1.p1  ORF type:complete len:101 (+),score=19.96 GHVP01004126.1:274-576(+)